MLKEIKEIKKSFVANEKHRVLSELSFPMDPAYVPAGVTKEQLLAIHRKVCREFYFRPKIMLRLISDLRSVTNFFGSIKGAFRLLKEK